MVERALRAVFIQNPRATPLSHASHRRQPPHHSNQAVNFFKRVVERQRRPHGGFDTEAAQDGLCAVVACALLVPDVQALDKASRKLLERFL